VLDVDLGSPSSVVNTGPVGNVCQQSGFRVWTGYVPSPPIILQRSILSSLIEEPNNREAHLRAKVALLRAASLASKPCSIASFFRQLFDWHFCDFTRQPRHVRFRGLKRSFCKHRLRSESVKVFGCRPMTSARHSAGPASENLQGRKPREGISGGSSRYGDLIAADDEPE
jgi:hypothetical protein